LASGDSEDVSMMHNTGYYRYLETNDYKIVELPYQGDRYSMVILLPKETDASLATKFSAADLNNWLGALQPTDLSLALPKFKLSDSMSLIGTLKLLGVTDAFDPISADLSGIDGAHDLFVSKVEHKAVVEVDETGTKAAAVTGIGMAIGNCICSGPVPLPFYADHPFHFLIRDQQTNSILFMGQVQTPTEYSGPDTDPTELPKAGFQLVTNPNIKFKIPIDKFDVDGDGQDTPLDALIVINYINDHTPHTDPVHTTAPIMVFTHRPDVDGDGQIIALDVLLIINHLNERPLSTLAITQGEAHPDTDQLLATSVVDSHLTTQDDLITPSTGRLSARRA
jgi:hypothetical protein